VILTGGEPLLRSDIFDIARHGTERGFRMVMAPNGTLLTESVARRLIDCGIQRISISLDGATAESHDWFRSMPGAFEASMQGIHAAKAVGLDFQINSSVTLDNLAELPRLVAEAVELGAKAHHIFLLVTVGRGRALEDVELSAEQYEETLNWLYDRQQGSPIHLKITCAPHYHRIVRQRTRADGKKAPASAHGLEAHTRGCLGGITFCFISHVGQVSPCGYLELNCGNVREQPFRDIWEGSPIFGELRDFSRLGGKCGACEYRAICGGCRARAHARTGDYLAEEPCCAYRPR